MTFGKCPDRSQSLPTRAIDCIRHCLLSIERFPIGCYRNPTRFLQENRWRTSRRWRKPQRNPGDGEPGADSRPAPEGVSGGGGHQTRGVSMNTLSKLPSFAADGRLFNAGYQDRGRSTEVFPAGKLRQQTAAWGAKRDPSFRASNSPQSAPQIPLGNWRDQRSENASSCPRPKGTDAMAPKQPAFATPAPGSPRLRYGGRACLGPKGRDDRKASCTKRGLGRRTNPSRIGKSSPTRRGCPRGALRQRLRMGTAPFR